MTQIHFFTEYEPLAKRAQTFVRFGKRAQTFVRFGKRAQTFVRFGRSAPKHNTFFSAHS
uniref:Cauli_VI domain-containing protein n=1 Tax=Angiostrongylus cantonensis TaxID=6313 RepID=A0A0K0DAQ4_ANGCA